MHRKSEHRVICGNPNDQVAEHVTQGQGDLNLVMVMGHAHQRPAPLRVDEQPCRISGVAPHLAMAEPKAGVDPPISAAQPRIVEPDIPLENLHADLRRLT